MKKKKIGLLFAAILLVVASVLGTMAYLTSTDAVENTFTVGNIKIKLDEAKANPDGSLVEDADRVQANEYKLIPGHEYNKDPMVTVLDGSEESYIRMKVTFSHLAELNEIFAPSGADMTSIFDGYDANKWELYEVTKDTAANTRTYEFRYFETVPATAADVALEPLFTSIIVPGTITNEQLANIEGMTISVIADAIQADGFSTADLAWTAFDN